MFKIENVEKAVEKAISEIQWEEGKKHLERSWGEIQNILNKAEEEKKINRNFGSSSVHSRNIENEDEDIHVNYEVHLDVTGKIEYLKIWVTGNYENEDAEIRVSWWNDVEVYNVVLEGLAGEFTQQIFEEHSNVEQFEFEKKTEMYRAIENYSDEISTLRIRGIIKDDDWEEAKKALLFLNSLTK